MYYYSTLNWITLIKVYENSLMNSIKVVFKMKTSRNLILVCLIFSTMALNAEESDNLERYTSNTLDNAYIMQNIQPILDNAKSAIFGLNNIADMKNLSEEQKMFFEKVYIIDAKTGNIISSPQENIAVNNDANNTDSAVENNPNRLINKMPDGTGISNSTIEQWKLDESRTLYNVGDFITTISVTKDRTFYIIAMPIHDL